MPQNTQLANFIKVQRCNGHVINAQPLVKRRGKAKLFPRKILGAPDRFVRKIIVCEESGEILLDEMGNLSKPPNSQFGIISPGDGRVCTLVDQTGKFYLPSVENSCSIADAVNGSLGAKLKDEAFVPIFSLPVNNITSVKTCQNVASRTEIGLYERLPKMQ